MFSPLFASVFSLEAPVAAAAAAAAVQAKAKAKGREMYAHTYNRSSWVFIALVIFSQLYYEEGRRERMK